MPQYPVNSISGNSHFDNSVSFQIELQNESDKASVQCYEWYLDGISLNNAIAQTFSAEVSYVNHMSARLYFQNSSTGIHKFSFKTWRTAVSINISGFDPVERNN